MPTGPPASEPPNNHPATTEEASTAVAAAGANPPTNPSSIPEVEYDDFGLPIRKARPRISLSPDSDDDSEEGELFKDAVSGSTSKEDVVLSGKEAEAEKLPAMKEPEKAVEPQIPLNGPAQPAAVIEKDGLKEGGKEGTVQKENQPGKEKEEIMLKENQPEKEKEDKKDLDVNNGKILEEFKDDPADKTTESIKPSETTESTQTHKRIRSNAANGPVSEFSHQQLAPQTAKEADAVVGEDDDGGWQEMPAYAHYDMYDDDNRLIAKENAEELEDMSGYGNVGGAAKGYTRVVLDDDVESVTSMDDNTAYLFKDNKGNTLLEDDDEAARDPLSQMQATKDILTEGQRVAYVGLVRLGLVEMKKNFDVLERNKNTKKILDAMQEANQMWAQKMMVRLYSHMDINETEQIMIEQLSEHGVIPADLTPTLMQNARVKNPAAAEDDSVKETDSEKADVSSPRSSSVSEKNKSTLSFDSKPPDSPAPPPYENEKKEDLPASDSTSKSPGSPPPYVDVKGEDLLEPQSPSQLPDTENLDIDIRWTILCDLFLVLLADSVYDSRSRQLLEQVGKYLSVDWLEISRFEKRVTEALEMQEEASKENWNEDEHMENRRKKALKRRIAYMGIATVGGTLVIGLSAGLLAPVIAGGLAAGFSTVFGLASTGAVIGSAGGIAAITTTAAVSGGTIAVRAANRRTNAVKTFEYRPLHNNKRANLIITLAGWMNGKLDDVRLPYSTIDPIMGDIYSVLWEPEVLRSMGDTINILATEVGPFLKTVHRTER